MISARYEWSKSWLMRPRENLFTPVNVRRPALFKPSYESNDYPTCMKLLLSWEYARIWHKERDEFVQQRILKSKTKFIKNNYEKWLEKRKPKTLQTLKC